MWYIYFQTKIRLSQILPDISSFVPSLSLMCEVLQRLMGPIKNVSKVDSKPKYTEQLLLPDPPFSFQGPFCLMSSLLFGPLHHSRPAQASGAQMLQDFPTPSSKKAYFSTFHYLGSMFSEQSQLHKLIPHTFQEGPSEVSILNKEKGSKKRTFRQY